MKKFILLLLVIALSGSVHAQQVAAPYPEPPSDEQKAEWKRLGDENLRKYGDGSVQENTQIFPTIAPTATPTLTPTATLTPKPTSRPLPTPTLTAMKTVETGIRSFFASLLATIGIGRRD
jgi:hypothetical protein